MTRLLISPVKLPLFAAFLMLLLATHSTAQTQPFEEWLAELRAEAAALEVSEETLELAFSEITAPEPRIIDNDRSQPERVQTYADYLSARVSEWKIVNGRERMREHQAVLAEVAAEYGVQPRFILAIWGMETNFGTYPIKESAFNVLATLAYDRRRSEMFRAHFLSAVKILDSGFPAYEQMKSSWAGAMGQPQFMPDSYLRYAVDQDGDGSRDIWDTPADVFGSIANYFRANGWSDDHTWGRPVRLPTTEERALLASREGDLSPPGRCGRYRQLTVWRDLQDWQALGVRRPDGGDLPTRAIPASLVVADDGDGEAYIVYQNFCGLMSYNPALKYALAIGLLSDYFQ